MGTPAIHESGHFYFAQTGHSHFAATVTGAVSNVTMHNMKEEAKDAASGMKKSNDEYGDQEVTAVKMVSKSCK